MHSLQAVALAQVLSTAIGPLGIIAQQELLGRHLQNNTNSYFPSGHGSLNPIQILKLPSSA